MTRDPTPKSDPSPLPAKHPSTATIDDVLSFKMSQLMLMIDRACHRRSKKYFDLNLSAWRVLALIKAHEPARASDIAELLLMDKSQLSRLIKGLMGKHLIKNDSDKRDARASNLCLTAKGDVLYREMMDEVLQYNDRVLEILSVEEAAQFNDMLSRLIAHGFALF
ncbi:MAG: MarR family winged helix-turn-helix transcriptional regulator [Sulfitobacter sp.]